MCAAFLDLESVIPSQRHLRRIRQAATSESVNTRNRAPTNSSHTCVSRLFGEVDSKQLPAHLHCRQCLLIGRQLGQASAPGLRGTREEIWSEGKAREKGEKQPKKRLMGNSTLSPDLNHSLSLLTFSMLCFWMILLLRLNFNLGNFSQLNLPDERMVLPAHDMILVLFQQLNLVAEIIEYDDVGSYCSANCGQELLFLAT